MSISAITYKNKNISAKIVWLHQCYCLDQFSDPFCILEFITKVSKGTLQKIEIHVPYTVCNLSNGTADLLDPNNSYIYSEGYKLIKSYSKSTGAILLDGIKTNVMDISLDSQPTARGSKIIVNFLPPLRKLEFRAIRIRFNCKSLLIKKEAINQCILSIKYYDNQDALFLGLRKSQVLDIEKFYLWIIFPYGAESPSITPSFTLRGILKDVEYDKMGHFYSSECKTIWKDKTARGCGMWSPTFEGKQTTIYPWVSVRYYCDYFLGRVEEGLKKEYFEKFNEEFGFSTAYKLSITKDINKKGTLMIDTGKTQTELDYNYIKLTEIQVDICIIMAQKMKEDKDKKDNARKGWVSYKEFKEKVESWYEGTDDSIVRNQISLIREKIRDRRLNEFLIEGREKVGYRLSTAPGYINFEIKKI